ncbi:hypothetical protein [Clostridium celatum]|uniref:hypothetical protein n=1 Tax=Clostridium celatum TaxID=36834 RepID=UPI001896DD04|nr:hypothetical protein [Clostridium celatum]
MSFWDFVWGKEVYFTVHLIASINVLYYYSSAIYRSINKEKDNSITICSKENFSKVRGYVYFILELIAVPDYISEFGINYIYIILVAITVIVTIIAMILLRKIKNQSYN